MAKCQKLKSLTIENAWITMAHAHNWILWSSKIIRNIPINWYGVISRIAFKWKQKQDRKEYVLYATVCFTKKGKQVYMCVGVYVLSFVKRNIGRINEKVMTMVD